MQRFLLIQMVLLLFAAMRPAPSTVIAATTTTPKLRCVESPESVEIRYGDTLLLRYNIVAPPAPSEALSHYERNGYLHPICSMNGVQVTGDFASDHPHQHGLFTAWTKTKFGGRTIDFWNQHKELGIVVHEKVLETTNNETEAGFQVSLLHCEVKKDGTRSPVLRDTWTVRVSIPKKATRAVYDLSFTFEQTNITQLPFKIQEYHYGGFGLRGSNEWHSEASKQALADYVSGKQSERPKLQHALSRFQTSLGQDRKTGNHSRPNWVSLYGTVQGELVGVRLFCDPTNDRHPHPVRLHPTKPYFSVSPCVLGELILQPGESRKTNYRIEVFEGQQDWMTP